MAPAGAAQPAALSPVAVRRAGRPWELALACGQALAEGMADYWLSLLERGATPLDLALDAAAWTRLVAGRAVPTWASPNEVLLRTPHMALRDFSQGSRADVVPTLVLPPQAGHHSCIVDFSPEQSQIKVIRAAGLERVYVLEWLGATAATRDTTVEDYLDVLDAAVDRIGAERVNVIGDCQGGWLATIYAALRPERINTLTIAGAPIDFHAGEGQIEEYVDLFARRGMAFYEAMVALGGGVMKGENMLGGFVMLKPESEIAKLLGLLSHLDDPGHLERFRLFEDWYKHTQDIPGAFYLWIVRHLFRDNELVRGTLHVGGERVDLRRIEAPVSTLAGRADHITPPPQVFALEEHVGTPPEEVLRRLAPGGHLGLFMGHEALREHWPPLLAWVLRHSRPGAEPARAARRASAAIPMRDDAIPAP
jgi:poly(3-hydroxyalkanoate) synthetase